MLSTGKSLRYPQTIFTFPDYNLRQFPAVQSSRPIIHHPGSPLASEAGRDSPSEFKSSAIIPSADLKSIQTLKNSSSEFHQPQSFSHAKTMIRSIISSKTKSEVANPAMSSNGSSPSTTPVAAADAKITASLEDLQSDEQRRILDTVAQVLKCGLESILHLPQLVVVGDQSAGKSTLLKALTEMHFPEGHNMCTRFATEIILRRALVDSLTIRIIPDGARPVADQAKLKDFAETISDFAELPRIIDMATNAMGLMKSTNSDTKPPAFAKDVLSIVIEGPTRPQPTVVDIPGLIASRTRDATAEDIINVAEITDSYIKQPRTICLAVVSAAKDFSNQLILEKVRAVDPDGERTLGVITKPDKIDPDTGSEAGYLELARNENIFFKLGWHVVKNSPQESGFTLIERNASETKFFQTSNFKSLPPNCLGIDNLRSRLSLLLFEHVKRELPKLRQDLENVLADSQRQLDHMGQDRSSPSECKIYLTKLSQEYRQLCYTAVHGHYEGEYFHRDLDPTFAMSSPSTIRRTRAVVQNLNTKFAKDMETRGFLYAIDMEDMNAKFSKDLHFHPPLDKTKSYKLSKPDAIAWARSVLVRNRGKELIGDYNPLLIGELLWEQTTRWKSLAQSHLDQVAAFCKTFLELLLRDTCPSDVYSRVLASVINEALDKRSKAANEYLDMLSKEPQKHPINYNHYYTETIEAIRQDKKKKAPTKCIEDAQISDDYCDEDDNNMLVDVNQAVTNYFESHEPDMEKYSCEEALTRLSALYKVKEKVWVDNITNQVIERYIMEGIEDIFCPVKISSLSDAEVAAIVSEPVSAKRKREFFTDRIKKLNAGHNIFKSAMSSVAV